VTINIAAMNDRLMQFLKARNLTSTRLADEIGVQRSSISHILSGRNKPSYDFIYKFLENYPDVNPRWLILGQGNMYLQKTQATLPFDHPPKESTPRESDISKPDLTNDHQKDAQEATTIPEQARHVEKIIILYSDKHFEAYHPFPKK